MNKAESERLGSLFERLGYRATDTAEVADVIVHNSCVVRQSAENRAVNKLDALKSLKRARPDLTIALTGCMVNSVGSASSSSERLFTLFTVISTKVST